MPETKRPEHWWACAVNAPRPDWVGPCDCDRSRAVPGATGAESPSAEPLWGEAPPAPPKVTERDMLDRLRIRYGRTFQNGDYTGRQYVIAEHVPTRPGAWGGDRIADAIVLDTWATTHRDLTEAEQEARNWGERQSIHGFEVKVSRSDWLTELRDPEKAEAWARYCHYFWLVASDKTIVRDDLPEGWGLLVPHGRALRVAVKAKRRDADPMPLPVVVSIARAVQKTEVAMATNTESEGK